MSKEELDARSMKALMAIASSWYDQMKGGEIPSISLPTRTEYNIEYDDTSEVWKYGDKESLRTAATAKSATHLLKMAYVIGFVKQQLIENRSSTFREMYYISEGWKRAKFGAQDESNFLVEDLEIISDVPREGFHLRPEENGARSTARCGSGADPAGLKDDPLPGRVGRPGIRSRTMWKTSSWSITMRSLSSRWRPVVCTTG